MNSENIDSTVLRRGVLLAIDRDGAKSLFGARGDDALRDFISRLATESSIWSEQSAVDCQGNWQIIDQCLGQMENGAQLQQCLLGGRPMYQGSEMTVTLIRPDLVPHLASGLDGVDDEALRKSLPADQDFADMYATFQHLRDLYRSAAGQRLSIVFAVEH